jgi:phospholipase C
MSGTPGRHFAGFDAMPTASLRLLLADRDPVFVSRVFVAAEDLPPYVFVEPCYFGTGQNDQHPPQDIMRGDLMVAEVFNSLQANRKLFEETLLIVLHDEHGGFYDHVPPPPTIAPDGNTRTFAFDGLGVRVPAILISPWLDRGFISMQFDHTSILKMACQIWPGVQPLGARTLHALSPLDSLTWRTEATTDIGPAPTAGTRWR